MFAVRGGRSFFSGVGIGLLPIIAQLTGWLLWLRKGLSYLFYLISCSVVRASASWNDRAHSVKLTLAALTLGVNAEAKCAISAPPPLMQRHVLCVSALFFIIGAASSSRSVPSPLDEGAMRSSRRSDSGLRIATGTL
ncbi:unnamed protein product [Heligmosomoides polygyrus]|uniref:Secreted protein n=1 Tax=Heligmosomoides polygyrus TaxID=6339 RepID=A0A183FEV9_HELPZ|nr:unnamed protein product [Heligmosomoides polygyrus]